MSAAATGGSRTPLVFLAIVLAAGAGGLVWALQDGPESESEHAVGDASDEPAAEMTAALSMPPLHVPADELTSIWDGERAAMDADLSPVVERLLAEYAALNAVSGLSAHHTFEGNITEIETSFREAVRNTVMAQGVDGYRYASWHAHARFRTALVAMLERVADESEGWDAALRDPTDPLTHEYFEACGDFAQVARATGLVTETGELTMPPELVTLLFRVRWFSFVRETYPLEELMSGPELRFYTDWRIREATNLPVARRMELLDEYETRFGAFPDDDGVQVRAALLAEMGRQDEAVELLETSR